MTIYICKTCGFFGFTGYRNHPVLVYGDKTTCASCGESVPATDTVDLGPEGTMKYDCILAGLGNYETLRCGKKQITLFG